MLEHLWGRKSEFQLEPINIWEENTSNFQKNTFELKICYLEKSSHYQIVQFALKD